MAHEVGLAQLWMMATLTNDSQLAMLAPGGVWRGQAPVGTAAPYVIVAYQSGEDITTMNGVRIISRVRCQARAAGPAAIDSDVVAAAGRIDELLDEKRNQAVTGGLILASIRGEPLAYDEVQGQGDKWCNFGGLYDLEVQRL